MTEDEYVHTLLGFIGEQFLKGEARIGFSETTPLMESGVLDSLRVALLLSYIRDELGVHVAPTMIDAAHFRDVRAIAGTLCELSAEAASEGTPA